MRSLWVVALLLAIGPAALAQPCQPEVTHVLGLTRERQSVTIALAVPLKEILEALERLDPKVGGSVTLSFTTTSIESGWRATCSYPDCCPAYVDVSIFSSVPWQGPPTDPFNQWLQLQHTAFLVPSGERRRVRNDFTPLQPVCHAEHTIYGETASSKLTLGVRVGAGPLSIGYALSSTEAEIWSSPVASCKAGDEDRCYANTPPTLHGPHYFTIPRGGTTTLVLIATDANGAADIVDFGIPVLPQGVHARLAQVETLSPHTKAATFYMSTDALLEPCRPTAVERCAEPSQAYLEVEVVDSCRKNAVLRIPVTSEGSPPTLAMDGSEFRDGKYWVFFAITDMDRGDRFLIEVDPVVGGSADGFPGSVDCRWEDGACRAGFVVVFTPFEDASGRYFDLKVTDKYGLSASLQWANPKGPVNRPPVVSVWPPEHRAVPGQDVGADVAATDPDGDRITLTQTSGPGSFARVEGVGAVSGTWSWTVPLAYGGSPWRGEDKRELQS